MINLLLIAAMACPLAITNPAEVYAKAYYLHENPPGERYVYTTPTVIVANATVVITDVKGLPVAVRWYSRYLNQKVFRVVQTCGEVPDQIFPPIFSDGLESGDIGRWSLVVGDEGE